MDGAVGIIAGYATLAELASVGIGRVGIISARRVSGAAGSEPMPWPHLGSIDLHHVVAAVATAAAVLLAAVFAVFHHGPADLGMLAVPVVLGCALLVRMSSRIRGALSERG